MYVLVSYWTFAERESKRVEIAGLDVEIAGLDDKCQITVLLTCTSIRCNTVRSTYQVMHDLQCCN